MRRELAPRAKPELSVRTREVCLDGSDAMNSSGRDLAVSAPRRGELRDPPLRIGQFARGAGA